MGRIGERHVVTMKLPLLHSDAEATSVHADVVTNFLSQFFVYQPAVDREIVTIFCLRFVKQCINQSKHISIYSYSAVCRERIRGTA